MSDHWFNMYEKAQARALENSEQVGILLGHMTNALIGLQSGDTKAQAIRTLEAGIKLVEQRQKLIRDLAEKIREQSNVTD